MRAIDADRLLEEHRMHTYYHLPNGDTAVPIVDIQHAPTVEPKPHWIPCSERLPEKAEGLYWVCTNTGCQCQCRWTDDVYGFGSNGEWTWKIFDIPQYSHVVAWMPLPEPYQEGEKETEQ